MLILFSLLASSLAIADDSKKIAPLVIQEQGSFTAGGTVITSPGEFDPKNHSRHRGSNRRGLFSNTIKAVELLGGMGKFVAKQSKVGLLINSPWDNPGSYVRPDITLAVIRMCREAGAKEIGVFKDIGSGYWKRSSLAEKFRDEIQGIRGGSTLYYYCI